jgi:arsenate reductase (glutaredoxin)
MSDAVILYGIENCDQVRKAKAWLKDNDLAFEFHDFRKLGLSEELLKGWFAHLPWDSLLNKRGLTWRKLDDATRASITDQLSAQTLMLSEPTLIKRPVLVFQDKVSVGFSASVYQHLFNK